MLPILFLIFILGASFGSFFSLFYRRRERGEDFILKKSYCETCFQKLNFLDLVPIFSYIKNRGTCKYCGSKIPIDLLYFEIIYGLIFLLTLSLYGLTINFIIRSIEVSLLFLISYTDLKTGYIYTMDNVFLFILEIVFQLINKINIFASLKFGLIFFGIFLFIHLLTRAMGFGDVELSLVGGLFARDFYSLLRIFTSSFTLAACFGLILIFFRKKSLKESLPFGPFLALGILIEIALGENLWRFYTFIWKVVTFT